MSFSSFTFWIIYPFLFLLCWFIRNYTIRKFYLIVLSYLLYISAKPIYALILFGITCLTYCGGIVLEPESKRKKQTIFLFSLCTLLPLLVFKYTNFIKDSISDLLFFCGIHLDLPGLNWIVPIGISFYTFQSLGYVLDVYRGKIKAERNFSDYLLFCSFFPQIACGPISKASDFIPQIKNGQEFSYDSVVKGLKLILWGMFLKFIVADRLGMYVDLVYGNHDYFSGMNCLIAIIFYSFQIYGDFAGYSLMAIGIAKTLGYDLINNFERPYLAESITLFWRRWHISLTKWLTSNVYIPLGGSRCSKFKQYVNIVVTFLVSGLWHGANWTFVIWGLIHGILQVLEKLLKLDPKSQTPVFFNKIKVIRILFTFGLVSVAWVFFRMPTLDDSLSILSRIFVDFNGQPFMEKANNTDKLLSVTCLLILLSVEIRNEYFKTKTMWLDRPIFQWGWYIMIFCMILSIGVLDASSFIYASF